MFKKNLCLISNFAITCILCIYSMLCAIRVNNILDNLTEGSEHINWSVAIIILCSVIIFVSLLSFLFNLPQTQDINKIMQYIVLGVSIVLVITSVLFYVNILSSTYRATLEISFVSDGDVDAEKLMALINNAYFNETFLIMLFASISSLVTPIMSLVFMKGKEKGDCDTESKQSQLPQDENTYVKNEIEKLKKQLELEELKKEYETLYKQLGNKENK